MLQLLPSLALGQRHTNRMIVRIFKVLACPPPPCPTVNCLFVCCFVLTHLQRCTNGMYVRTFKPVACCTPPPLSNCLLHICALLCVDTFIEAHVQGLSAYLLPCSTVCCMSLCCFVLTHLQRRTNGMDGVVPVTQRPVKPGGEGRKALGQHPFPSKATPTPLTEVANITVSAQQTRHSS
jgi:hypothetical protein